MTPLRWVPITIQRVQVFFEYIHGASKSIHLKTFAYISPCGHPLQMKINPVVCHLCRHLFANIGPLISIFMKIATFL